ncbi:MAG: hypothetical protein HY675_17700 [Chloroflexi bacterium]|nr:hypothetical protein [Chloroflexota bacterium]
MEEPSRITPEEAKALLDRGRDLIFVDVRGSADYEASPIKIRGALRFHPGEIVTRSGELPRDKLMVPY